MTFFRVELAPGFMDITELRYKNHPRDLVILCKIVVSRLVHTVHMEKNIVLNCTYVSICRIPILLSKFIKISNYGLL